MTDTVLSHLALKFTAHPENLATEALGFILRTTPDACEALAGLARQLGYDCPEELTYRTQVSNDDGGRPDIVGVSTGEQPCIVVEAKFWAGLTDAQPIGYLNSIQDSGGLLLFVVPSLRLDTLWRELLHRCDKDGRKYYDTAEPIAKQHHVRIEKTILALISWRTLLDVLEGALDRTGNRARAADIQQLRGLCDKMDSKAFLPLQSEELTSSMGRRIIQFGQLASDLTDILVTRGEANVKGLRATGGNGWYGRYLRLKGYGCFLGFHSDWWIRWGGSPLWLELKGSNWKHSPSVRTSLTAAGIEFHDTDNGCYVPIRLIAGEERDTVIRTALTQIDRIINALQAISGGATIEVEPPPDLDTALNDDMEQTPTKLVEPTGMAGIEA